MKQINRRQILLGIPALTAVARPALALGDLRLGRMPQSQLEAKHYLSDKALEQVQHSPKTPVDAVQFRLRSYGF